jgi:hypothetical protein
MLIEFSQNGLKDPNLEGVYHLFILIYFSYLLFLIQHYCLGVKGLSLLILQHNCWILSRWQWDLVVYCKQHNAMPTRAVLYPLIWGHVWAIQVKYTQLGTYLMKNC